MTKNHFEKLNKLNVEFFERAKLSLLDPLGIAISKDIEWIEIKGKWNYSKFPVVNGGEGDPLLLLHGFDSSFLEFRRIYPYLKKINFVLIFLIK